MLKLVKYPGKEMSLGAFWDECLAILGGKPPRTREDTGTPLVQNHDGVNDLKFGSEAPPELAAAPTDQDDEYTVRRLADIEEKLSQLLREVTDLKNSLKATPKEPETKSRYRETAPPEHRQISEPEDPGHFILDFETWLAEQEKSKAKSLAWGV